MDWRDKQDILKEKLQKTSEKICNEVQLYDTFIQINERWGVGETLFDFFWWDIKINSTKLGKKYSKYTDIILSPDRIDKNIVNNIGNVKKGNIIIVNSDSWGIKAKVDHIDVTTGNIHRKDWTKNMWGGNRDELTWNGKIKQLILVTEEGNGHLGPRIAYAKGEENTRYEDDLDYIIYQKCNNIRKDWISKVVVPKKCYYPQIFEEAKDDEDVCKMLKNMLERIT